MIHRDIKPSNILISNNNLKLCDFGSAIFEDKKVEGYFENEGFTTWYKAPEILFGDRTYNYQIDIWSAGCIFGEVIRGIPVFPGVNDFHMIGKITNIIGTPNKDTWPDYVKMPNYGKIDFYENDEIDFVDLFSEGTKVEIAILQRMLKYGNRNTAKELLKNSYFQKIPKNGFFLPSTINIKSDNSFKKIFNLIN